MLQKRRFYETDNNDYVQEFDENRKVTLEFLIAQPRMLSKTEYNYKYIKHPYTMYMSHFYKRRVLNLFTEMKSKEWFCDRYLNENLPSASKSFNSSSFSSPMFIVIEDFTDSTKIEDIKQNFISIEGVKEVFVEQKTAEYDFKRDVYLSIDESVNAEALIESLQLPYKAYPFNISSVNVDYSHNVPVEYSRSIFESLCSLSKLNSQEIFNKYNEGNMFDINDSDIFVKILRDEFRYCTICARQYDTTIGMIHRCISHSINDFSFRNIEIASVIRNFSDIPRISEDLELESYISRGAEQSFRCKTCSKLFKNFDCVKGHIQNKHSQIIDELMAKKNQFELFISNIDFFILNIIEGTDDKTVPVYGKASKITGAVVYDFPVLFSGDIKLN